MSCSLFTEIAMGDEGHGGHCRVEQLAALFQFQRRSSIGQGGRDVAHGDRPAERRRMAAGGDPPDLVALAVEDQGAFAYRLPPLDEQADALLRRAALEFREDALRTSKPALRATPLADRKA